MKRATLMVIGVLLVVAGVIWTLQGLDVFGGTSGMNGHKMWAVIGPIVAIVGIVLAVVGARSRSRASVGQR
ncbi:MAG TPA: hypothetical protein VH442_10595 [Micromonosporaceae bacterium]